MKKVSIIIPVYQVEDFFQNCIETIVSQSYKNFEIIIVDDGSLDSSPEMCEQYALMNNIQVVHKPNAGLASARLAGFSLAMGDYILFVDSDDYISPYMVEKLVQSIEQDDAQLAMCGYYTVTETEQVEHQLPYEQKLIVGKENVLHQYILPLIGSSKERIRIPGFLWIRLLRRSLIQSSFFGSERKYFLEDHYFDLLYSDNIERIAVVNEPLYYYRFNPQSLSNCYRENKWFMYKNAVDFYTSFALQRDIECADRIEQFQISAVLSSIDNAVMSGSYERYLSEIYEIANTCDKHTLMKNLTSLTRGHQLRIILFLMKLYRLLYVFRLKRISTYYRIL